jgi:hypothetical protein
MKWDKTEDIKEIYWMIKNGYSKENIKDLIFKMTGKTIDELDQKDII